MRGLVTTEARQIAGVTAFGKLAVSCHDQGFIDPVLSGREVDPIQPVRNMVDDLVNLHEQTSRRSRAQGAIASCDYDAREC